MKTLLFLAIALAATTLVFAAPRPGAPAQTVQPADSTDLKPFAGTYTFDANDNLKQMVVTVENGELYGAVDTYPKSKLVKQAAADTFKSTSEYGSVFTFKRDAATKQVTGFSMEIMGNTLTAKKDAR
ncbi:DUF3471 domain-containing protein [Larkinella insperata]|uniref:DUF3471 domain-containing protein n=1 Tax=Larkinella insperata TaxID=332158 RepID=A0ABW3Q5P6_9BACT|nr:DUF3471 domain-containing protein [Larkinella insperata]